MRTSRRRAHRVEGNAPGGAEPLEGLAHASSDGLNHGSSLRARRRRPLGGTPDRGRQRAQDEDPSHSSAASVKRGMSQANRSPSAWKKYSPSMNPLRLFSTQKLWYSCTPPGTISGCSPTTPSPTTSVSSPQSSWMHPAAREQLRRPRAHVLDAHDIGKGKLPLVGRRLLGNERRAHGDAHAVGELVEEGGGHAPKASGDSGVRIPPSAGSGTIGIPRATPPGGATLTSSQRTQVFARSCNIHDRRGALRFPPRHRQRTLMRSLLRGHRPLALLWLLVRPGRRPRPGAPRFREGGLGRAATQDGQRQRHSHGRQSSAGPLPSSCAQWSCDRHRPRCSIRHSARRPLCWSARTPAAKWRSRSAAPTRVRLRS